MAMEEKKARRLDGSLVGSQGFARFRAQHSTKVAEATALFQVLAEGLTGRGFSCYSEMVATGLLCFTTFVMVGRGVDYVLGERFDEPRNIVLVPRAKREPIGRDSAVSGAAITSMYRHVGKGFALAAAGAAFLSLGIPAEIPVAAFAAIYAGVCWRQTRNLAKGYVKAVRTVWPVR